MNSEEIRKEKELCFAKIKEANFQLDYIRGICKHENTFEGIWEWRIGSTYPAIICSDCGSCVKNTYEVKTVQTPNKISFGPQCKAINTDKYYPSQSDDQRLK